MKTLFDHAREKRLKNEQPLAARMRPRTLDEYIGQGHILAPGRLLRRAIQADQLSSLIFYGPPGTGKTTLATVIANATRSSFVSLNAVMAGIADLREITGAAQRRLGEYGLRTILFVDEVHRWNKAQQDALLPWVENGTVVLIGATTENPYFTVNRALVSRSRIFQLKELEKEDIRCIVRQTLADSERGYGKLKVELDEDALEHLANVANGDARAALNALELAVETTPATPDQRIVVTLAVVEESIQHRAVLYDREGDYHFDTVSALIKSLRGSDPDAAFYWLAKMVYAGEDPRFIFRRLVIFASEDIGMADPHALPFVMSAAEAFDRVGLPEGHYPLSHATLYCATAPKSNSVMGFFDALKLVGAERDGEVPNHLRDASRDKEGFGHGVGYKYPHSYREHWVAQQYLPDFLQGKVFYHPGEIGYERELTAEIRRRREVQLAAALTLEAEAPPVEILSFSPVEHQVERWLARTAEGIGDQLATIRERVFAGRRLQRQDRVLDLSGDIGVFAWEATRRVPEGGVWMRVSDAATARRMDELSANLSELRRPYCVIGANAELPNLLAENGQGDVRFELMVGRNVFVGATERKVLAESLRAIMASGGTLAVAESLPCYGQRLTDFVVADGSDDSHAWRERMSRYEEVLYHDETDPLLSWNEDVLSGELRAAGFFSVQLEWFELQREQRLNVEQLRRWFCDEPGSYASRLVRAGACRADIERLSAALPVGRNVLWRSRVLSLRAASASGRSAGVPVVAPLLDDLTR